jgi:hypothetical protein
MTMRLLKVFVLSVAIVASLSVLIAYGREQYWLWLGCDGAGLHLLAEPRLQVFRALTHEHGERDGWWLASAGEIPEGTRSVISLPTWPLALAGAGVLAWALLALIGHTDKSALN